MKALLILFIGILLAGSCTNRKQSKNDLPQRVYADTQIDSTSDYVDWQVDSFYHFNYELTFRSTFLTKNYLSRVDTLNGAIALLNSQISALRDSLFIAEKYIKDAAIIDSIMTSINTRVYVLSNSVEDFSDSMYEKIYAISHTVDSLDSGMSGVRDTLHIIEKDADISGIRDSLRTLYLEMPSLAKRTKVIHYNLGPDYSTDTALEFDLSQDTQMPAILQFFVVFNTAESWGAMGTFSIDLENIRDSWYGVTCPEGLDGNGAADFKASYTIQYDKDRKKITIQRVQMGRKGKDSKWYNSFADTHYGIKSIVALY
jgi:hypothetical protein